MKWSGVSDMEKLKQGKCGPTINCSSPWWSQTAYQSKVLHKGKSPSTHLLKLYVTVTTACHSSMAGILLITTFLKEASTILPLKKGFTLCWSSLWPLLMTPMQKADKGPSAFDLAAPYKSEPVEHSLGCPVHAPCILSGEFLFNCSN